MRHPNLGFRVFGHVGRWLAFFRRFVPLAGPFWASEDKWRIRAMLAALVVLTALQIVVATAINLWIQNLFNSLENRDMARFIMLVGVAGLIMLGNIVVTILHLTVKRWLQIGWREWVTGRVQSEWMTGGLHYRVTLFPGEHSNPDGRIAEDIRIATENAIDLAHSLVYTFMLLSSFLTILWTLSGAPRIEIAGHAFVVPGYLVWLAVLYAFVGTAVALRLGLPLVVAQNFRQSTEADFRFGLAHARQNSLQLALLHGERREDRSLRMLFHGAIRSWHLQTRALVSVFYFSSAWWVLSQVIPILVAAPRYIAGAITLGVLMQTAQAFGQVVGAMSWPVDNVGRVADWRASAERVLDLHDALAAVRRGEFPASGEAIGVATGLEPKLILDAFAVAEPDGTPMMAPISAEILSGQRVLIGADSVTGFRLLKALARLWPWGSGRVALPRNGPMYLASRRPYLPPGLLRDVLSYPETSRSFSETALAEALGAAGLRHLVADLDRPAPWEDTLSEDEQHRLGFARILLRRPHWIVLHETLDALAPETRGAMMAALKRACPGAAVVLIGHDPGDGFVTRRIDLSPPARQA